jgi:hypothetical protein
MAVPRDVREKPGDFCDGGASCVNDIHLILDDVRNDGISRWGLVVGDFIPLADKRD